MKDLERNAKKCEKQEKEEKVKLKKVCDHYSTFNLNLQERVRLVLLAGIKGGILLRKLPPKFLQTTFQAGVQLC